MSARPDFIGAFSVSGKSHFFGATIGELDRAAFAVARVLRTFGFAPGSTLLTISLAPEVIHFAPLERAIQMLGLFGVNADDSPFDAGRVESISRQFDPPAMCGVSANTIEGLRSFGHDPEKVFKGRTIWARPDAYEALKAMDGVDVRRLAPLGPTLAFECALGGVHYDSRDWNVDAEGAHLAISSRSERAQAISGLVCDVVGRVGMQPCRCGNRDATIVVGG